MYQPIRTAGEFRRRRIAEKLCSYANRKPEINYKFIKDIVPNKGIETANQIINSYEKYTSYQKDKVFIIGYHKEKQGGEHIHFYHVCRYTQSKCRCAFIDNIPFKRREPKYIVTERPFQRILFENIIKYLSTGQRQLIHIQIGSDPYSNIIHRFENLRLDESIENNAESGMVEACEHEVQNVNRERYNIESTGIAETKRIKRIIDQGYDGLSKPRAGSSSHQKSETVDYLIRQLLRVLSTPIESACDTEVWYNDKNLSIFNSKSPDYQTACSTIMKMTSQLSFKEIYEIHNANGCLNIYGARNENHYFNREESFIHIQKLLEHQYNDVHGFVQRLFNITERLIPKRNSIFVRGE